MSKHFEFLKIAISSTYKSEKVWHCFYVQVTPWIRLGVWLYAPGIKHFFYVNAKPWHFHVLLFPFGLTIKLK